jgi:ATP-binding cassette subfamily B protein
MPADAVARGGSRLLGWLADRVHARRWPRVRQQDASDCGAACLAAVGRYHGARAPVALLRQLAGTDRAGTTLLGLAEAAARIGLAATGVRGAPDCLARVPLPAIAHLAGPHGAHHYVVLYRVSGRAAVIMDPADGRLHRSALDEFVRRWSGVLLLIAPASSAEPLPAPPSGARRLWLLVRPHRTVLAHALAGAVVHTLLGLATAVYVQKVVDQVIPDGNRNLLDLMTRCSWGSSSCRRTWAPCAGCSRCAPRSASTPSSSRPTTRTSSASRSASSTRCASARSSRA